MIGMEVALPPRRSTAFSLHTLCHYWLNLLTVVLGQGPSAPLVCSVQWGNREYRYSTIVGGRPVRDSIACYELDMWIKQGQGTPTHTKERSVTWPGCTLTSSHCPCFQHEEYVKAQLTAFRQGERTNSAPMSAIAANLSDKEIDALSDYIAGLR